MNIPAPGSEIIPGFGLPDRKKTGRIPWRIISFTLLLTLALLRIPHHVLTVDLDDSWRGVLNYGHDRGWQFGSDVVFTYGPLGYLSNHKIVPGQLWLRILYQTMLSLGVALGLLRIAARLDLAYRILLIGSFWLLSAAMEECREDLFFDTILLCWGLLCWVESGPRLMTSVCCLVAFTVIGSLSKFNWFLTSGLTIAVVIGNFWLQGRRRLAIGVAISYAVVFLGSWGLLEQKWSGLWGFVRNSMLIAKGFDSSMAVSQVFGAKGLAGILVMFGLAVVILLAGCVSAPLVETRKAFLRRGMLFCWAAGVLFMQWKHGIARADWQHLGPFLVFLPTFTLIFKGLLRRGAAFERLARKLAVLSVVLSAVLLQHFFEGFAKRSLVSAGGSAYQNLCAMVFPAHYLRYCGELVAEERDKNQLPGLSAIIGRASVDVFGRNQMVAVYNHWNYAPRPIFQNYLVYSDRLSELNQQFYRSPRAPEFVLFHIEPIDDRFPPLEDPQVLRELLINYDFAGSEKDCILLRHARHETAGLTLLSEGKITRNQPVSVAEYGDTNLWLELDPQPSLIGRFAQFICKISTPKLQVERESPASGIISNAPPLMLAAGFLASPMILGDEDVTNLYAGNAVMRPRSYTVLMSAGSGLFWKDAIRYRIFRIDNPLGFPKEKLQNLGFPDGSRLHDF